MDTNFTTSLSNVFFPRDVDLNWIFAMTRKNIDIFKMVKLEAENKLKEGIGLVSLDDDEIKNIILAVTHSKDYVVVDECPVTLVGTNIEVDALIIDPI